jgi:DNA (cytosine-5)-methyltransferase 1
MRELSLFSGAGGGILGGKLLGWQTVCAVEIDEYCQRVLMQRQDDGIIEAFPIWPDIKTFDGYQWVGCVDIITGGFPCQDISVAGRGKGIEGNKSGLWVEMARIIREIRPRFAFVENSPMLTSRGLGTVLGDLAEMGFDARWGVFSACAIGAPHTRERMFILAYSGSERWDLLDKISQIQRRKLYCQGVEPRWDKPFNLPDAADRIIDTPSLNRIRNDDGLAEGMDRLKAIGNGQVPGVVEMAFLTLLGDGNVNFSGSD